MSEIAQVFRRLAHEWVDQASSFELMNMLAFVDVEFAKPTTAAAVPSSAKPARRVPKKVSRHLSPEEGRLIRGEMAGLVAETPQYRIKARELCKRLRITPRQLGGVLSADPARRKAKPAEPQTADH